MDRSLFVVGSIDALRVAFDDSLARPAPGADVVVLPTAAAFIGVAEASVRVAEVCNDYDVRVEALMVTDRASASEPYFVERVARADVVVLCDGSPLHARTVWRKTPVGEAIEGADQLIAIGSVASVLGEVMIDPRGGAPTTGLGLFGGVAFSAPASEEQLARTRKLLGPDTSLIVVGARGVLRFDGADWIVIDGADVVVTGGHDAAGL